MGISSVVFSSFKKRGVFTTIAWCYNELLFDIMFRSKTTRLSIAQTCYGDDTTRSAAAPYQGTNWKIIVQIFNILKHTLDIDLSTGTFVDIGSGTGRVLISALHYGCQKVIGVELDPTLCEIAKNNIANHIARNKILQKVTAQVIIKDAAQFDIPTDSNVIFLYNPFKSPVLDAVATKILKHALLHNNNTIVVYVNPVCVDVFYSVGFCAIANLTSEAVFLAHPQSRYLRSAAMESIGSV